MCAHVGVWVCVFVVVCVCVCVCVCVIAITVFGKTQILCALLYWPWRCQKNDSLTLSESKTTLRAVFRLDCLPKFENDLETRQSNKCGWFDDINDAHKHRQKDRHVDKHTHTLCVRVRVRVRVCVCVCVRVYVCMYVTYIGICILYIYTYTFFWFRWSCCELYDGSCKGHLFSESLFTLSFLLLCWIYV